MLNKPLVIGAPRTGFSLLIQIVSGIENFHADRAVPDLRQSLVNECVELASVWLTGRYIDAFSRQGITSDLIYNGEFHLLVGGPKWVHKTNPDRACFRKYFGVRGMGDFLMSTSHPRHVLDYYPVVHSHTAPALWPAHPHFGSYRRIASIRNPIGVINSACFSLNAMASEYVQKFLPDADETFLRQRLALYKLTDLEFVRGLIRFLADVYDEFLKVRDRYPVMRWEDLIARPAETICDVAHALGRNLSQDDARRIWRPMDHINTLEHHKHNYRAGKGIVGDWKNSLVREHMELFREHGFDRFLQAFGYPPIPDLDPEEYSPFQKLVAGYIQRGEVYRVTGDADLFGFAFNKSNIDASKFGFKSFPQREWTHVERSTLTRDDVVEVISDVAEEGCGQVNRMLARVIDCAESNLPGAARQALLREWKEMASRLSGPARREMEQRLVGAIRRCA